MGVYGSPQTPDLPPRTSLARDTSRNRQEWGTEDGNRTYLSRGLSTPRTRGTPSRNDRGGDGLSPTLLNTSTTPSDRTASRLVGGHPPAPSVGQDRRPDAARRHQTPGVPPCRVRDDCGAPRERKSLTQVPLVLLQVHRHDVEEPVRGHVGVRCVRERVPSRRDGDALDALLQVRRARVLRGVRPLTPLPGARRATRTGATGPSAQDYSRVWRGLGCGPGETCPPCCRPVPLGGARGQTRRGRRTHTDPVYRGRLRSRVGRVDDRRFRRSGAV